jgi:hypothetical protein
LREMMDEEEELTPLQRKLERIADGKSKLVWLSI